MTSHNNSSMTSQQLKQPTLQRVQEEAKRDVRQPDRDVTKPRVTSQQQQQQQIPAYKGVMGEMQAALKKKTEVTSQKASDGSRVLVLSASKSLQQNDESNVDGSVVVVDRSRLGLLFILIYFSEKEMHILKV